MEHREHHLLSIGRFRFVAVALRGGGWCLDTGDEQGGYDQDDCADLRAGLDAFAEFVKATG